MLPVCNVSIAIDPFAFFTFVTLLAYMLVEDDRYKNRLRKLIEIREMMTLMMQKTEERDV